MGYLRFMDPVATATIPNFSTPRFYNPFSAYLDVTTWVEGAKAPGTVLTFEVAWVIFTVKV